MNPNSIQTVAQYGDVLINSKPNASVRGSGQYNPPPLYEQTTNRGPAYTNALNYYEHSNPLEGIPNKFHESYNEPPTYQDLLTQEAKQAKEHYTVGSSGFHPERPGDWKRPLSSSYANTPGYNIPAKPIGDQYQEWAMNAVHQDPSALLNFFFSSENVDYLQNRIIEEVKRIKKVTIDKQSADELLQIMQNHYQLALSGWLPRNPNHTTEVYPRGDPSMGQDTPCSLTERLTRLNKSVLEETIKQVLSGVDMYQQYYKDASSLPLPLERPTLTTQKGSRVLSENVGFNSGHEFTQAVAAFNEKYNII